MRKAKLFRPIKVISDRDRNDSRCYRDLFEICSDIAMSPQMSRFSSLSELINWLKWLPFRADNGGHNDCRCRDGNQRLIPWSSAQNCWEKTAHCIAGIIRFGLPVGAEEVIIIDWKVSETGRHIFPVIRFPGYFMVIDLDEYDYSRWLPWVAEQYTVLSNRLYSNEWYNDLLGGVHLVGKTVLGAFGMGGLGETLEKYEADNNALPDWAITNEKNRKPKTGDKAPTKSTDAKLTASNVTDNKDSGIDLAIAKAEAMLATQNEMLAALKRQKAAANKK